MGFLVLGVLGFTALIVFGVLAAVFSLVGWILFLPFKLFGFLFRGVALLLALPFFLLFGGGAALVFGLGIFMFLIPALPLVLIALGVWWLMKRRAHPAPHAT